jgi:hypothetical protein
MIENKIIRTPTAEEARDFSNIFGDKNNSRVIQRENTAAKIRAWNRKMILQAKDVSDFKLSCFACYEKEFDYNLCPSDVFAEIFKHYQGRLKFHSVTYRSRENHGRVYEDVTVNFICGTHNALATIPNVKYSFSETEFKLSGNSVFFNKLKDAGQVGEEVVPWATNAK